MSGKQTDSKCGKDDEVNELNELNAKLATFIGGVALDSETQATLTALRAMAGVWAARIMQSDTTPILKHDALRALLMAKDSLFASIVLPKVTAKVASSSSSVPESDSTMKEEFEEFLKKYKTENTGYYVGMNHLERATSYLPAKTV